jgi:hypothetical protein
MVRENELLPHSALSSNFILAENLANLSLQDGATKWYYSPTKPPHILRYLHHISCATTTTYPALPPPHILRYHLHISCATTIRTSSETVRKI